MKILIISLVLMVSSLGLAAKSYQVTGVVLDVKADTIIVDKKGEKFEIAWPANTKLSGGVAVKKGDKVTVYYTMSATEAEIKSVDPKAPVKNKK